MKKEMLNQKEKRAQASFLKSLKIAKRKTKKPIIVALVGLVGSGKSSIARELAKLIDATIIEGDAIRVCLRKAGERYENTQKIGENAIEEVIKRGGNVILDSDFINAEKRKSAQKISAKFGVKLIFVRTYADYDVMVGRVISAKYRNKPNDFFGGASTKSQGSEQSRGVVVKLREMWRRTPNHYRWENKDGGRWILKKLPFPIFATIDTTDSKKWKSVVKKTARKLLKF